MSDISFGRGASPFSLGGRRSFLRKAGALGALAVGSGLLGETQRRGQAAESTRFKPPTGSGRQVTDADILNFALNLEYLEAEFYLRATTGSGLDDADITGNGDEGSDTKPKDATPGTVTGGSQVTFTNPLVQQYAMEIAADEEAHVKFLRSVIPAKDLVARPTIDLQNSFTDAAIAAGIITTGQTFDPFSSDANFLLGAFIFEDVGVTAYHGAAPFITNSTVLSAAAGILGTEAYHASLVRTVLFSLGQTDASLITIAGQISALRATASGAADDQGLVDSNNNANIVPTDSNALVFSRTFQQVLNVVYLGGTSKGGFFPDGTNGLIS
jgi:hypothetical protein